MGHQSSRSDPEQGAANIPPARLSPHSATILGRVLAGTDGRTDALRMAVQRLPGLGEWLRGEGEQCRDTDLCQRKRQSVGGGNVHYPFCLCCARVGELSRTVHSKPACWAKYGQVGRADMSAATPCMVGPLLCADIPWRVGVSCFDTSYERVQEVCGGCTMCI